MEGQVCFGSQFEGTVHGREVMAASAGGISDIVSTGRKLALSSFLFIQSGILAYGVVLPQVKDTF